MGSAINSILDVLASILMSFVDFLLSVVTQMVSLGMFVSVSMLIPLKSISPNKRIVVGWLTVG